MALRQGGQAAVLQRGSVDAGDRDGGQDGGGKGGPAGWRYGVASLAKARPSTGLISCVHPLTRMCFHSSRNTRLRVEGPPLPLSHFATLLYYLAIQGLLLLH